MIDLVTTFYVGTIPGSDAAAAVDVDVLEERYLSAVVAGMGAGATLHRARGAWRAAGGLVVEESIVIETIATIDDDERASHRELARKTAQELCKIGAQQEVYVTQRERDLIVATP
jgi:hypothetical protein